MRIKEWSGKQVDPLLLAALKEGTVSVPHFLLRYYKNLKLSDVEAMLLVHLTTFIEKEKKDFPTPEEIQSRMSSSADAVISMLQKLLKEGLIGIDQEIDSVSGVQYERYNLDGLYEKLGTLWLEDKQTDPEMQPAKGGKDIYTIFEKEFARPLTPMELETITGWLDQDRYKDELILAALKEAVFAGKVHFRYIDRILLEWSRNRVFSVEQAKEYAQRFRK